MQKAPKTTKPVKTGDKELVYFINQFGMVLSTKMHLRSTERETVSVASRKIRQDIYE
tara:strand:+ start:599 stop:769 length:171 start_codon:yes stop_codon:yes gene_type:complete